VKKKQPPKKQPKKPTKAKAKTSRKARPKAKVKAKARPKHARAKATRASRWVKLVEQQGVVLASARGPVPSVAEAVAGEPIVGSWWAHPKGKAIFAALSEIDDSEDIRCFKLIDGKVTFVHRRAWPALVRLTRDGVLPADAAASLQQEHMPTGEHRNVVTPFPDWVDEVTAKIADEMTPEAARAQHAWLDARKS
jgi:hypothetical protein